MVPHAKQAQRHARQEAASVIGQGPDGQEASTGRGRSRAPPQAHADAADKIGWRLKLLTLRPILASVAKEARTSEAGAAADDVADL
jgi:hypothetical protein